jgi:hypothetical protein
MQLEVAFENEVTDAVYDIRIRVSRTVNLDFIPVRTFIAIICIAARVQSRLVRIERSTYRNNALYLAAANNAIAAEAGLWTITCRLLSLTRRLSKVTNMGSVVMKGSSCFVIPNCNVASWEIRKSKF